MIEDVITQYTHKVALAKRDIEEAGLVPKVIYQTDLRLPFQIKVTVDIEATLKSQTTPKYDFMGFLL